MTLSQSHHQLASSSLPCVSSFAWTSALVGGLTIRDDDLAASMVLFFVLLIFLVIGFLRTYQGRHLLDILIVFTPTLCFVICLTVWSGLRAHLSNLSHHSSELVQSQTGLLEVVAANGLVSCSPILLGETAFQAFGLLAKRIAPTGRKWVRYTAYTARLANLIALIMVVVGTCDYASFLTAWLDQTKLASVVSISGVHGCGTTVLGRDLTLLPLMADGLELVVLFVLVLLMISLRLRYRLAPGVVVHMISIQCCLAFHFAWKCSRDWTTFQLYLSGNWSHPTESFPSDGDLEYLAKRIRRGAEDPTLFYLLGVVPLVLAMVLIYTINLNSYTNPPPTAASAKDHLTTRFRLFLDPASPRIELLPTSKTGAGKAGTEGKKDNGSGGKGGGNGKDGDAAGAKGEMYVVKRGWLGGWSVQPAQTNDGWANNAKKRARQGVQSWVLGWSSATKPAPSPA